MKGYDDDREIVDRAEAERAVGVLSDIFARMA